MVVDVVLPEDRGGDLRSSPQEIQANYGATGPDAPIVVEYRQIPNSQADDGEIRWTEPEACRGSLRLGRRHPALAPLTWRASAWCSTTGVNEGVLRAVPGTGRGGLWQYNVVFTKQFDVGDNDVLECVTTNVTAGSFFPETPGSATTGRIDVNRLGLASVAGQTATIYCFKTRLP